jgi:hypothetical protein
MWSILHGDNSTAKAEWHPNPVTRGTWNIYQTCVVGKWKNRYVPRNLYQRSDSKSEPWNVAYMFS